ncbi:DUF4396 domain-containing protein [Amorphus orientalis]|uniref:DUF4396 domain-containing protein n=1 Tax=Amorphus orientalis TaxID=649198 RepID=A0AAE4AQW8_9HYPH|nr:DUF4396 domain-containing protein [Amorphus orientalis]MDQ0313572.1 hypothetical protein [Amorphus orientalis]
MVPMWLHWLAIVSVAAGIVCAVWIALDERKHPQHMWIMNLVWPLVALSGSLFVLWAYHRIGRNVSSGEGGQEGGHGDSSFPVSVGKGTSHCGAGCTLGDIVAEWLVVLVPVIAVWFGYRSIFSEKMFAVWIVDYLFAFGFGIAFQYYSIKPMRGLSPWQGLVAAVKADALSLTAWQVGMYGFMAVAHFWLFGALLGAKLEVVSIEFWFMMQIAMICGFVTAYPVNWWLIRSGIKEAM